MKKVTVENAWFQKLLAIKTNRKKRYKAGAFIVEGVKNINAVMNEGWEIDTVIIKDGEVSNWAKEILDNNMHSDSYIVAEDLMEKLSDREEVSEVMLLVKMRDTSLLDIEAKDDLLLVVYDRPAYPGNLGTVIRTCDALKVDGIIVTGHAADVYDSATIRASVGTLFKVPIYRTESHKEVVELAERIKEKNSNLKVIGTTANTEEFVNDVDYNNPVILLVGNETTGLTKGYKDMSNTLVKIPMYGAATSYNVGCATSIVLYEVARQRGF